MPAEPQTLAPVLITGGTGAIGQAAARALVREDRPVVLWVRELSRGEATRAALVREFPEARVELVEADMGNMASVRATSIRIASTYPLLGAVVHTAAVLTRHREETPEGLERMFATNHLAPFQITRILTERLDRRQPMRVLTVTAPATTTPLNFEDLQSRRKFRSLIAFGASKTANLLFSYALARRFGRGPWTSNIFFPGVVRSALMREAPFLIRAFSRTIGSPPDAAGEAISWLVNGPPIATTNGAFFEGTRLGSTSEYTTDIGNQDRLWEASERLLAQTAAVAPDRSSAPALGS